MFARLTSLNDQPHISLAGVLTVVGRQETCNARVCSSRVSRRHCCLIRDRDDVVVFDLKSSNGIRINGRRVEDGVLHPGDVLEIAHLRYRLDLLDDADRPTVERDCPDLAGLARSDASDPIPRPDELHETSDYAFRPSFEG